MTALLTDNLPLLAGAPNGIKKLRELILELAVRGKLVPQDPSDEPASQLLKRIAVEKARLVAEEKIKKQKPLVEIDQEDKPFDVPTNWEWVRIAAVGHDWGQKTPGQAFTYIDVGAIDNAAGIISTPQVIMATDAPSRARKMVRPGTVIYSTIRPYLLNVAVIDEAYEQEPIASTAFAIIHPYLEMPARYFLYYLRSPVFVRYVESVQMGIAYPAINDGQFFSGLIPLPPVAEQHRIVAKVDELMALCDRLEAQQVDVERTHAQLVQALLDSLIQASDATDFAANWQSLAEHFQTLFTTEPSIDALKQTLLQLAVMGKLVPQDPSDEPADDLLVKIATEIAQLHSEGKIRKPKSIIPVSTEDAAFEAPQGWKWLRLSQITRQLGDGLHGTPIYNQDGEFHFVNGNNLKGGKIVIKPETKTVSETEYSKHKKPLDEQSLLVSINGTIGNVAFYNSEKIVLGKSACYLNLANGVSKHFVRLLIEAPGFMKYALKSATGTTIKNLGLKAMNDYPIALPPLNEQHRIVAKVDQLMALCDQLKNRLTQARQLNEQLASTLVEQALA
ncbi:restriction endonuclease subunit S [Pseudomonas sp. EZ-C24]|uniref:restriction endonuclease subunit S n=1 Tax=Pseudomonas sp. EZ-C24 TaxID=2753617 RepID=UPI00165E4AF6|nr:restriction endonuclease subunit S [Pseudomonas sp. EZ-C24]